MSDAAVNKINLKAVKLIDSCAVEIEEPSTQVAVYKFNSTCNDWVKTDFEGTLLLYRRSEKPFYGFVVLNRLRKESLVEVINPQLDIQAHPPFLLYRNQQTSILGIWFYDETDCLRVADKLSQLIRLSAGESTQDKKKDLLSVLQNAQADYEQRVKKSQNGCVTKPVPTRMDNSVSATELFERSQSVSTVRHQENEANVILECFRRKPPSSSEMPTLPSLPLVSHPQPISFVSTEIHEALRFSSTKFDLTPVQRSKEQSHIPLMSPMMFTSSKSPIPRSSTETVSNLNSSTDKLLSQDQFVDAFVSLLKSDSNFAQRLHEAYVKETKNKRSCPS
uniref:EOG090X07B6 n=1 Tax=Lynceus sp. MCZ IZ 141354 TaxID=1930659 RepID=A0A9N6WVT5_9CRUS|nr:EOG090X07B6 [Lynceus sp. MCZ IZ 141354]